MKVPANRVAAVTSVLVSLGALVAAVADAFPGGRYTNALVAVAALVAKTATVLKFLDGSQKHEARALAFHPDNVYAHAATLKAHASEFADEEPGDPDGAPELPTGVVPDLYVDGKDSAHA